MLLRDRELRRILIVEKMIMMPVKAALLLFSFLFYWAPDQSFSLIPRNFFLYQSGLYIAANAIFFILMTWGEYLKNKHGFIKVTAFILSIIDNLYLSFLIPLTGGLESPVYWIYSGMMIRNAINFPRIRDQGLINFALCLFYGVSVYFSEREAEFYLKEVFYLKIIVLVLISICCWGIYALIQRKVAELEEERELKMRTEKIHAVRRLAGEIAHGLKNPLGIMNNASYYLMKHLPESCDHLKGQIEMIREEIERSDQILSRIMNFSKLSSIKIVKLHINQALVFVIDEIHPETAFPNIVIEKILGKNIPPLFLDEGHLKEILSNLIINSAEALSDRKDGKIVITTKVEDEDRLLIAVADNGTGIDANEMSKIFNPFFTTKEKGTGLGLSIVKNIVETYDGTIEVKSQKGEGSVFSVRLPVLWTRDIS